MNFPTQDIGLTTSLTPTTRDTAVQTQDNGTRVKGGFAETFAALPRTDAKRVTLAPVAAHDADPSELEADIEGSDPNEEGHDAPQSSDAGETSEQAINHKDNPRRATTSDMERAGEVSDVDVTETVSRPLPSASERLHGLARHQPDALPTGQSEDSDLSLALPAKNATVRKLTDVNHQRSLAPARAPTLSLDAAHVSLPQGRSTDTNTATLISTGKTGRGPERVSLSTTSPLQPAPATGSLGREAQELPSLKETTDAPIAQLPSILRPVRHDADTVPENGTYGRTSFPLDTNASNAADISGTPRLFRSQGSIPFEDTPAIDQPRSTQSPAASSYSDNTADAQVKHTAQTSDQHDPDAAAPSKEAPNAQQDGRVTPVPVTSQTTAEIIAPASGRSSKLRSPQPQNEEARSTEPRPLETLQTKSTPPLLQTGIRSDQLDESIHPKIPKTHTSDATVHGQMLGRQIPSNTSDPIPSDDQAASIVSNAPRKTAAHQVAQVPEKAQLKSSDGRSTTQVATPLFAESGVIPPASNATPQVAAPIRQQPDGTRHDMTHNTARGIQKPVETTPITSEVTAPTNQGPHIAKTNAPTPPIPGVQIGVAKSIPPAPIKPDTQTPNVEVRVRAGDGTPAPVIQAAGVAPTLPPTEPNNWARAVPALPHGAFSTEQRGAAEPTISLLTPSDSVELFHWDPARQLTPQTSIQHALRTDMMPQITRQMAEALPLAAQRPVEIALSPAELGRVRMSVSADDGSIVVSILAERPETLDLMRRHIDQLGSTFRSMGYEQITFAFGQGADTHDHAATDDTAPNSGGSTSPAASDDPTATQVAPETLDPLRAETTGVDIRL